MAREATSSNATVFTLGCQLLARSPAAVGMAESMSRPTSSGKSRPKLMETSSATMARVKRPRQGRT